MSERKNDDEDDKENNDGNKPYAFLEYIFIMMMVFPGFLFLISPPQVPSQVVFRTALLVVGLVGLVIIHVLRTGPR